MGTETVELALKPSLKIADSAAQDSEIATLQKAIKEFSTTSAAAAPSQVPVRLQIALDYIETILSGKTAIISIKNNTKFNVEEVDVVVSAPAAVHLSKTSSRIDSLAAGESMKLIIDIDNIDSIPSSLDGYVAACYKLRDGRSQNTITKIQLPLELFGVLKLSDEIPKTEVLKLTCQEDARLIIDSKDLRLASRLFTFYNGSIVGLSQTGRVISIWANDDFVNVSVIVQMITSSIQSTVKLSSVPFEDMSKHLATYLEARHQVQGCNEMLETVGKQFQFIQMKLLVLCKEKTTVEREKYSILISRIYERLLNLAAEKKKAQNACESSRSNILSHLTMALLTVKTKVQSAAILDRFRAVMYQDNVSDDEWIERVDLAICHMLANKLARSNRDGQGNFCT